MLSDIEKEKLKDLNEDPVTLLALKKVLLASIYSNGTLREGVDPEPLKNAALSLAATKDFTNEQLGEDLRGLFEGIRLLEQGFKELSNYKEKPKIEKKETNPGK